MNNPRPVCEHQQPTRLRVRSVRAGGEYRRQRALGVHAKQFNVRKALCRLPVNAEPACRRIIEGGEHERR